MFLSFLRLDDFFLFSPKKIEFWGILGPPYYGIGATIRIGWKMFCLPYEVFFRQNCFYNVVSDSWKNDWKGASENDQKN